MFRLQQKCVVITGASSGIGKQTAITCARLGARVALFGRNEERLSGLVGLLEGDGHISFSFDITDTTQLEAALTGVFNTMGLVDGFVHSAGIQKTLPFKLTGTEVFSNQFKVNVLAGFESCRIMLRKNYFNPAGGSIVLISSINGVIGAAAQVAYSASKGAVISGVKSLALELAPRNIRVNSISPGMVENTQMTKGIINQLSTEWEARNKVEYPMGWVSADDVANGCVFLLSDASQKITGTNLIVDGGFSAR